VRYGSSSHTTHNLETEKAGERAHTYGQSLRGDFIRYILIPVTWKGVSVMLSQALFPGMTKPSVGEEVAYARPNLQQLSGRNGQYDVSCARSVRPCRTSARPKFASAVFHDEEDARDADARLIIAERTWLVEQLGAVITCTANWAADPMIAVARRSSRSFLRALEEERRVLLGPRLELDESLRCRCVIK
jgi:hypothetical protein